jgi:hypothetical protein
MIEENPMDTRKIDLHVHSTASDGTVSPGQLVEEAKAAGLAAFALTDHDTVAGIEEVKAAARECDIEVISGVELSTEFKEKEVHMVGLFLDETNPVLLSHLKTFRDNRDNRNEKMYQKLREEGFSITEEALQNRFPDAVLTRAHVARFLLEQGAIRSMAEAFETYIGDGCRCYVPREKITPAEGISLIRSAGGVAVLAHPILYHMSDARLRELICHCKDAGLTGIEAIYSTYQPGDERYIRRLAAEYELKLSGGSDFHGSNKPDIRLGSGRGHLHVPYALLEELRGSL